MTSMGVNMGMGGVQVGPNVSAANVGYMPSSYAPAYANPAPAYVAGVGAAPYWNMTGSVLVLYILLVIITRCVWI
jgi:hypothetical protein